MKTSAVDQLEVARDRDAELDSGSATPLTHAQFLEGVAAQRATFEKLHSRFSEEEAEGALAAVLARRRKG